jgi:hypothetical protein
MIPATALPEHSRKRLSELRLQQLSSDDAGRAANVRLNGLGRDADPQMVHLLTTERDKHNERHRSLALLVNRLNQFLMELRPSTVLEPAPAADVKLRNGETLATAIEATRNGIKSLQGQLQVTRRSPLPLEDRKRAAEQFVARLAQQARPIVSFDVHDRISLRFKDSVISGTDDLLAFCCWLDPQAVLSALMNEVSALPTPINPLPAAERMQRVAELEKKQLELERAEEAMIQRAAGDGIELLRRPDADPRAVLGLAVKQQTAQVP